MALSLDPEASSSSSHDHDRQYTDPRWCENRSCSASSCQHGGIKGGCDGLRAA